MTSSVVQILKYSTVGVIEVNNPPVNALSQQVRQGIWESLENLENDNDIKAIIIHCIGKTFIAGADITEFGKPPVEPFLPDLVNKIENLSKPVIAALFGTSLGGGFEVALSCHYRVAVASAKVGLPEVNLGLLPGAGGTQRLPRILGTEKSLEMITSGKHYQVTEFENTALFDEIYQATVDLKAAAIDFATNMLEKRNLKVRAVGQQPVLQDISDWDSKINKISLKARGKKAPVVAAELLKNTQALSIEDGMKLEREAFLQLKDSEQSSALRYAFSIERLTTKLPFTANTLPVKRVAIIGGGTMGSGIATAFLASGYQIKLFEQNQQALDAGFERINDNFHRNVKSGRMSDEKMNSCLQHLELCLDYKQLSDVDLVVEAVFENIEVKQQLFKQLDEHCRADCILASNTSYLDIEQLTDGVSHQQRIIGMHFFSPANIMKLVEVIKTQHSSEQALTTAVSIAKSLGKIPVLVGMCFGFAANRMYARYGREVQQMLLEGATIEQIDNTMTDWGMAMGPLSVQDLAGIDIGYNARKTRPKPEYDPGFFTASTVMVENGRLGRKTGKGFYLYENGKQIVDPQAQSLIDEAKGNFDFQQKDFTNEMIVERAMTAIISEGLSLFKEGIVQRLSDIDAIWLHGYGFPRHKGGPMFQGKVMGSTVISDRINQYRNQSCIEIWPDVDVQALD